MKLVIIIGNAAVGKMTVGQELMKITDLRLFHNHMTIEPIIEIFGYFNGRAISRLRRVIFEEFAESNLYGMIFTYMWAFDQPSDWEAIKRITDLFEEKGGEVYYVELVASKDERLKRNVTENRLNNKASKRDLKSSEYRLQRDDESYRLESYEGEMTFEHYIKIDNTNMVPEAVAEIIKNQFDL